MFTKFINPVIYISSLENSILSSQEYLSTTSWADNYTIVNCCFSNCVSTNAHTCGGALSVDYASCNMYIFSSIFTKCTSTEYGGAIYSKGMILCMTSTIFSGCQSEESGSAIFSNKYVTGQSWSEFISDLSLVKNNIGKYLCLDINFSRNICSNSNITNNKNRVNNLPISDQQFCSAYPLLCDFDQECTFIFNNLIGNDGDFLIDLKISITTSISNVNIINNANLNLFFHCEKEPRYDHFLSYFTFFGNQAHSKVDGIKFANSDTSKKIELQNCIFEYSLQEVNSMLNSHTESGGSYGQILTTFIQNNFLIKPTICQIDSDVFTSSATFTSSNTFTKSITFSESIGFTKSITFSESTKFTSSSEFSLSSEFSKSSQFTKSAVFTISSYFSLSSQFTESSKFSFSMNFSPSSEFSFSSQFSSSSEFKATSNFSPSSKFSLSIFFSYSSQFSPSSEFSHTSQFSISSSFTVSSVFSLSLQFTSSNNFGYIPPLSTSNFSPSVIFSESKNSPLIHHTPTKIFTPSNPFTPSFIFTPNRTRFEDPKNIFYQKADISGNKKIFTKEEFKKAAGPATVFLIFIPVSIVVTVFYIQRKIKQLKNRDNVPDFDSSLNDDENDDSESNYSYSYYVYSYYYSDSINEEELNEVDQSNRPENSDSLYSEFTYDDYDSAIRENGTCDTLHK